MLRMNQTGDVDMHYGNAGGIPMNELGLVGKEK